MNDLLPDDVEMFQHIILKNEDQFVKSSYDMPVTKHLHYQCLGNVSTLFDGILSDTVIEMIQAGNISGVYNNLTEEKENTFLTIIDAYKSRKMKRLQELQKEEVKNIEKIKMIESHLNLLHEKIFKYVIQYPCMICKKDHEKPSVLTCCQHIFCGTCVTNVCPLCRSEEFMAIPLEIKELSGDEEQVVVGNYSHRKNKIETILDIISDAKDKKILVFSNYNESFTILKKFLDEKGLCYLELRGTKEKRDNTIDLYKTGSVNILLLNTIHSGAGLNLQETSDIILYHRIHEYQKIQVIGRANRIGRKIQLNVHYLE
jgi:SNF2 family DNA or RNA helicase